MPEEVVPDSGDDVIAPDALIRRLEDPSFPLVIRGYDPASVDLLLADVRAHLALRPGEGRADPVSEVAELVRRVAAEVAEFRRQAQQEHEELIESARDELVTARQRIQATRKRTERELEALVAETVRMIGLYSEAAAGSILALGADGARSEISPGLRELLRRVRARQVPGQREVSAVGPEHSEHSAGHDAGVPAADRPGAAATTNHRGARSERAPQLFEPDPPHVDDA